MGAGKKERYRVVSVAGDLVEKSGTMSGGGKSVSRGRMSARVQMDVTPVQVRNILTKLFIKPTRTNLQ